MLSRPEGLEDWDRTAVFSIALNEGLRFGYGEMFLLNQKQAIPRLLSFCWNTAKNEDLPTQ